MQPLESIRVIVAQCVEREAVGIQDVLLAHDLRHVTTGDVAAQHPLARGGAEAVHVFRRDDEALPGELDSGAREAGVCRE